MASRQYYSVRMGTNQEAVRIDLPALQRLLADAYLKFDQKDYFQQAFGYTCVDAGVVAGDLGTNVDFQIRLSLRKADLWPISEHVTAYSEDDVFDLIEFLYDCVSKPVDGIYHSYAGCGWHYSTFDKPAGQAEFRNLVNQFLPFYQDGYELSERGEILTRGPDGLQYILEAEVPHADSANVVSRVRGAVRKYRFRGATVDDRRDAIRDLADVLEFLRPQVKQVLNSKDESDIFELANRFGIRHHNAGQVSDYPKDIWYSWAFYYYLATVHACLRLIERRGTDT